MGNGNFKIGDKVKRISHPYDDVKIGTTGVVIKINEDYDTVRVKIDCMSKEGTWAYSYIEKVDNHPITIIQHKGRETIATLKDGKNVIKTSKATCNPTDTFDEKFGKALALARLNDDLKMIDWLVKGEEKPFIPTQLRIVKQDKYEVGDKVKVRDDLKAGNLPDGLYVTSVMPELRGKIVTIKGLLSTPDRYDICESSWSWSGGCFDGKVIEEPVASGQPLTTPVITSFDWEGFKAGKFAVHCDTEEKAKSFLWECEQQVGIRWTLGEKPTCNTHYHAGDMTCYSCVCGDGVLGWCGTDFHAGTRPIIDYTPNYREVKRPAKVGEWIKVVSAKYIPTTNGKDDYKNGDILKVLNIDLFAGKPRYAQGIGDGGIAKGLTHDEYVVLVPSESIEQPKPLDISAISTEALFDELRKRVK